MKGPLLALGLPLEAKHSKALVWEFPVDAFGPHSRHQETTCLRDELNLALLDHQLESMEGLPLFEFRRSVEEIETAELIRVLVDGWHLPVLENHSDDSARGGEVE